MIPVSRRNRVSESNPRPFYSNNSVVEAFCMPNSLNFPRLARRLLIAGLFPISTAWASGGPPMITDDPGTPGDGHWEINIAALSNHTSDGATYQLPLIDANYGVGDRLQLKFEMPWLVQDEQNGASRSGSGNGLLGVKWRFYDAGEDGWQISTYPQWEFGLPHASSTHDGLADSGTSTLLPLEFVHGYDGFDINFEAGRWFRPGGGDDSWIAGFVVTHEVRKGLELIAEVHDESAVHHSAEEQIVNFGARWDMSEQTTLLLSAGRDVRNTFGEKNTLITYLGIQLRL